MKNNQKNPSVKAQRDAALGACKLALNAIEAELLEEDPAAATQMEWEGEPMASLRAAIALDPRAAALAAAAPRLLKIVVDFIEAIPVGRRTREGIEKIIKAAESAEGE